jgi:hypothetical protein
MSHYGDRLGSYVSARPALTGAWQISGRSDCGFDKRVELDALALLNRSFHIGANRGRRYRAEGKLLTVQAPISCKRGLETALHCLS